MQIFPLYYTFLLAFKNDTIHSIHAEAKFEKQDSLPAFLSMNLTTDPLSDLGEIDHEPGGHWLHVEVVVEPDAVHQPDDLDEVILGSAEKKRMNVWDNSSKTFL